jgi:hypothetical protein
LFFSFNYLHVRGQQKKLYFYFLIASKMCILFPMFFILTGENILLFAKIKVGFECVCLWLEIFRRTTMSSNNNFSIPQICWEDLACAMTDGVVRAKPLVTTYRASYRSPRVSIGKMDLIRRGNLQFKIEYRVPRSAKIARF